MTSGLLTAFWECSTTDSNFTDRQLMQAHFRCRNAVTHFYAAALALDYLHTEIDKLGVKDLVYTTGEVVCHPCVHTCVPDYFDFSFDSRHEKAGGSRKGACNRQKLCRQRMGRLYLRG